MNGSVDATSMCGALATGARPHAMSIAAVSLSLSSLHTHSLYLSTNGDASTGFVSDSQTHPAVRRRAGIRTD